jgi:hypothetical protein
VDEVLIKRALHEIETEVDPTVKNLRLASITSEIFREAGIELVVVGGSAIEFYTEGAYTSGDVDFCIVAAQKPLTVRTRQELMGKLQGKGGPRSWQVAGGFVDVLSSFENLATTPLRRIQGPYGEIALSPVEELIVERVLVSVYPESNPPARFCAQKLISGCLRKEIAVNWTEVERLARGREYDNFTEVRKLIDETATTLGQRSPIDSHE